MNDVEKSMTDLRALLNPTDGREPPEKIYNDILALGDVPEALQRQFTEAAAVFAGLWERAAQALDALFQTRAGMQQAQRVAGVAVLGATAGATTNEGGEPTEPGGDTPIIITNG